MRVSKAEQVAIAEAQLRYWQQRLVDAEGALRLAQAEVAAWRRLAEGALSLVEAAETRPRSTESS